MSVQYERHALETGHFFSTDLLNARYITLHGLDPSFPIKKLQCINKSLKRRFGGRIGSHPQDKSETPKGSEH